MRVVGAAVRQLRGAEGGPRLLHVFVADELGEGAVGGDDGLGDRPPARGLESRPLRRRHADGERTERRVEDALLGVRHDVGLHRAVEPLENGARQREARGEPLPHQRHLLRREARKRIQAGDVRLVVGGVPKRVAVRDVGEVGLEAAVRVQRNAVRPELVAGDLVGELADQHVAADAVRRRERRGVHGLEPPEHAASEGLPPREVRGRHRGKAVAVAVVPCVRREERVLGEAELPLLAEEGLEGGRRGRVGGRNRRRRDRELHQEESHGAHRARMVADGPRSLGAVRARPLRRDALRRASCVAPDYGAPPVASSSSAATRPGNAVS